MIRWIPYTFVRTVLFFIGGILLGMNSPDLIPLKMWWVLVVPLTGLYFLLVFYRRNLRRIVNPGWIALPLVFILGYINVVSQTQSRDPEHLLNYHDNVSAYRAVITRFPEERARSWKIEGRVTAVYSQKWVARSAKVVLYFSKEDFPQPFWYGDVMLIKGQPQEPPAPSNPGEFDYPEYLRLRNIYHQHFIREGEALKIDHAPPNLFMDLAYKGRRWAGETLKTYVEGPRQQAIAAALVLGVTDGLDDELLSAYSATGSMHILAVSGLHISVLYFILLWILSPLNKVPTGRWMIAFISLTTLWLYGFVTGLPPSVLRAVGMFSFLAIARPWAKSTNIYNTLAVSAFCLLMFDPFLVRSVGFQLSYLAVLGIVYIYPRILRLWEPDHWITMEVWKLAAVSFAAQIATFPLGLLYFHQFPNYFLLSNLFVVPLSFVVLIVGLMLLGFSFIPMVAMLLGFCLEWTVRFLNGIVFTLEGFPYSMISDVYITPWQCALLLAFIVALLCLFEYRKFSYLVVAFVLMAAFGSLQWLHFFREVGVHKLAVYNIPGHSAIDLMDHGRTFFIADTALQTQPQKLRFHVIPHRQISGVVRETKDITAHTFQGGRLILWQGKKILLLTDRFFELPGPLDVDWLVIANNSLPDIGKIQDRITVKKVLLDSSNTFFFASRFLEGAKLYKLEVHSVLHQGAFILKFENEDT